MVTGGRIMDSSESEITSEDLQPLLDIMSKAVADMSHKNQDASIGALAIGMTLASVCSAFDMDPEVVLAASRNVLNRSNVLIVKSSKDTAN